MQSGPFISKTFPTAAAAALPGKRVVVQDASNRGNVKLPGSTVEQTAVGVTVETQPTNARGVEVAIGGIVCVESDGSAVINPGDKVIAVANTGRVKAQAVGNTSNTVLQILGTCVNNGQVPNTAAELVFVEWYPFTAGLTT